MNLTRSTSPVRFWMTGAFAVVMAALCTGRVLAHPERQKLTCLSRYGVAQTAQLIETTARRRGLGVFARVKQPGAQGSGQADTLVVVFESSGGGTPVMMEGEGVTLRSELPLRLEVHPHGRGASEVWIPAGFEGVMAEMPHTLAADLAELPGLVADALA